MKLILIAGMYRSGSTWLYNVARIFLENNFGNENVYGCFVTDYNPNDGRKFHIVKIHEYNKELADSANLIVLSERDFPGIAASMSKFHGSNYSAEEMKILCEYYPDYNKNHSSKSASFLFTDIMQVSDKGLTGKISSAYRLIWSMMGMLPRTFKYPSSQEINNLVTEIEQLPIPDGTPDYADPTTLLHPKHKCA